MRIRPAAAVLGETLRFREVEETDARFILDLRVDERKGRFLSPTRNDEEKQAAWIRACKHRDEAYFVICDLAGDRLGAVRLYDAVDDSFSWGSWIIRAGAPARTAMESALMVYDYALNTLSFSRSHFDVRKGNASVIHFHLRCGAVVTREDEVDVHFRIDRPAILAFLERYRRYLPSGARV